MAIKLTPLAIQEMAAHGGFTHMAVITADDLTETATATTQSLSLGTIPAGAILNKWELRLQVPFEDLSDSAFDTNTIIVGDAGSSNRYITSAQLNGNGTEITIPQYNNTAYQVSADTEILAVIGSKTAKSLSDIDAGELHLFVQILDTKPLSDLKGNAVIAKA